MDASLPAYGYLVLALAPIALQLALAGGAALGRFTMGGRFPEKLPLVWRMLALVQAALLAAMSVVVLDHAGVIELNLWHWLIWSVLALTVMTLLANAFSPSTPERRLWTPVIAAMLVMLIAVLVL